MILMKLRNLTFLKSNLSFIRQDNMEFYYFSLKHLTWADNIILIKYICHFEDKSQLFLSVPNPIII